jgi:ABC-type multidrug transport system fused ATPase/permease subunit
MTRSGQQGTGVADWRYLGCYLRGLRVPLLGCIALALLQSVSLLPIAWLVRRAFDSIIPSRNVAGLALVGFEILVLNIVSSGLALTTRFASLRTTKLAITSMRRDLVVHCQSLPRAYHDTADRGKLHTLLVQETLLVDIMINALIVNILPSLVLGAALIATMAVLNLRLLALLALATPLLLLVNRRLGATVKAVVDRHRDAFIRFSSGVQFMLQRIDLTRYQSAEAFETRRQNESIEALRLDSERMAWLKAAYELAQRSAVTLGGIIILVIGGLDVVMGRSTMGSLMSFYVATILFGGSLQQVFTAVPHVLEGRQSLAALRSFSDEDAGALYTGKLRLAFEGSIELESVSFGYDSRGLLEKVNLLLEPGSVTVVVGPNGGGKTTLARLILGLYRPQRGRILADRTPYDQLDIADLRQFIAFTPQDPIIFAGTIWENLAYGLDGEGATEIVAACRIALVDEFVRLLPEGYETRLDEDGGVLSGGQRQKIAIARALARQPRLLILDEPTNHLDEESIRRLLHNLRSVPNRPATLMITQNPNVAEGITRRYLLNDGALMPIPVANQADREQRFCRISSGVSGQ